MTSRYHRRKTFFEDKAKSWDKSCNHDPDKILAILKYANLQQGNVVLDVGCGTGILIPEIIKMIGENGKIVALDYAENMIIEAQKKFPTEYYPNVTFLHTDYVHLHYHDYFDRIIFYSCFPHFDDHEKVLTLSKKYLHKTGGIVIAHSQSRDEINHLHARKESAVSSDYLPSVDELHALCTAVSLKIDGIIDNENMFIIRITQ